jgi:hypothetical protein
MNGCNSVHLCLARQQIIDAAVKRLRCSDVMCCNGRVVYGDCRAAQHLANPQVWTRTDGERWQMIEGFQEGIMRSDPARQTAN